MQFFPCPSRVWAIHYRVDKFVLRKISSFTKKATRKLSSYQTCMQSMSSASAFFTHFIMALLYNCTLLILKMSSYIVFFSFLHHRVSQTWEAKDSSLWEWAPTTQKFPCALMGKSKEQGIEHTAYRDQTRTASQPTTLPVISYIVFVSLFGR